MLGVDRCIHCGSFDLVPNHGGLIGDLACWKCGTVQPSIKTQHYRITIIPDNCGRGVDEWTKAHWNKSFNNDMDVLYLGVGVRPQCIGIRVR